MATTLDELSVKFTADIAGLKAGLEKIEIATLKMAATTEKATSKMSAGFAKLGRFFTAGAIIAGVRQLAAYSSQLDALGSSLVDMAGRANVSIESLQRLRFAADQNGGSADAMDTALVKLNKAMGEVIGGSEEMAKTFDALGLLELVKSGADTEQVLLGVADALKEIDRQFGPQLANAASLKIMGKNADELGVFMRSGAAGVRDAEAAMSSSAIISSELARKLDGMADKTSEFNLRMSVLGAYLESGFIDAINFAGRSLDMLAFKLGGMSVPVPGENGVPLIIPLGKSGGAQPQQKPTLGNVKNVFGGSGGDGAATREANEAERAAKKYQAAIADLVFDLNQLGVSEAEAAFQLELHNRLSAAGVTLMSDEGQAIKEKVSQLLAQKRAGEDLAASWAVEAANANREIAAMHEEMEAAAREWQDFTDRAGDAVADAFGRAILEGEGLREVLAGLLDDLARLILQKLVLDSISSAVSSGIGGFVAGFASGGGVSGGNPYLVGERGPELFIPNVGGDIVPNRGASGGNMGFSYAPTINSSGNNTAEIRQMLVAERVRIFGMMNKYIGEQSARGKLKLH